MIGPLRQLLPEVASFLEAYAIELVEINIEGELCTKFFRAFKQADCHAVFVIVLSRILTHLGHSIA